MADNTTLNTGSGGDTLATDDIGGVKYPRSKIVIGADGTNDGDVSSANPLPVSLASVPSHAVTNAGTFAVQAAQTGTWTVTGAGGSFPITDSSGSITVDAPAGTPVFVRLSDGSAAITTLPVSLASVPSHAVTNAGTFATQIDGAALTALQLIDNIVLAEDALHASGDPGVQLLAVRDDANAGPLATTDGDYHPLKVNSFGELYIHDQTLTDLSHAEDAGHSTGDTGIMSLAVRNDSDTSLCGATLDYTPLQVDANGYLKVNIKAGAGSGGTASTDDAAFTAASGSGTPMMGFVTSDAVDSGDVGVVGMLANRQLKVTLYDSGGSELSVGGGTQYDEDTAHVSGDKVNMAGVVRTDSLTALSGDGDRTVLQVNSVGRLYATLGTEYVEDSATPATITGHAVMMERDDALSATPIEGDWLALKCNANGALWTAVDGTVAATQSGTWNVGTVTTVTTVSTVTTCSTVTTVSTLTGSGVAHDGADSGNPHKIGMKATTSLSGLTLVANADRTDLFAGVDGVQITRPHCNLEDIVTATPVAITDGSSTSVISAQGSGIKVYIVEVIIANSSSSNVTVDLRDGTAGAVKATFPVPANGGVVKTLATPLPFSANTAVAADPSAAASTVTVTLIGFKSKV